MTLPGQMELNTVIDHKREWSPAEKDLIDSWSERSLYPEYPIDETSRGKVEALIGNDHPALRADATHKPLGVRLAKMLNQYDDSPSSQIWSDIQGLAREILK